MGRREDRAAIVKFELTECLRNMQVNMEMPADQDWSVMEATAAGADFGPSAFCVSLCCYSYS